MRRRPDVGAPFGPQSRITELDDQKGLDRQIAQSDIGSALWHCARRGGDNDLPANAGLAASRRAIVSAFPNASGATVPRRPARPSGTRESKKRIYCSAIIWIRLINRNLTIRRAY